MPDNNQQVIPVRPTVFVGLGGTGKEILLRLRMKFYERYGDFRYPCMSYIWIDTDMQNLNVDKKDMDPLLKRALFNQNETVDIQVLNPSNFLNNPQSYSWITRWMPPAVVQSGLRIQDGAGQVRAKGRFGFYWKFRDRGEGVQEKLQRAITEVRRPQAKLETAAFSEKKGLNLRLDDDWGTRVNFFVAASLAGGTGSGIFLDAAFLIRQIAIEQNFKPDITGMLFLSSLFTNDTRDRRFANTYAALKELEYYNYTPESNTPEAGARNVETTDDQPVYALRRFEERWSDNYPHEPVNGPPFNTCYLIDGYTYGGTPVTPDHKYEVFDMASEYLFWEFYRGEFAAQKRTLRPNNRQYLDRNQAEPHGDERNPFHMQRFSTGYSSFGLSWIRIPLGSRIAACAYRLNQEMLEYWERGGLMDQNEAKEALRKKNIVDEVRRILGNEPFHLSGTRLVEDIAATRDGTRFSTLLEHGLQEFYDQPVSQQIPSEFASVFEDRYIARRLGAVINDNIEPSRNRVLSDYKASLLKWIMSTLETEGFIPLLGFTFENPDRTQGKVSGYLDIVTDVILPEIQAEIEALKDDHGDNKTDAGVARETFFNNFDELDNGFVLFKTMSRRVLTRRSLEEEQKYAKGEVGEWVCDTARNIANDLGEYVKTIKAQLRKFYDNILSPTITKFAELRRRYEVEERCALSINLYKNLDDYYRLGSDPVDVKAEKEQLFRTEFPRLEEVTTQMLPDRFAQIVESYGWTKFQSDFQRRLTTDSGSESLGNVVQLFNEVYPPSDSIQRRNQISIFVEGGKPYVQPRQTFGPRTPQPHEDIVIGMKGVIPPTLPGSEFFEELRTQHNLGGAQGIEAEPEAVLYYHELTGLPLFYLSSLEQYRQSYDLFQGELGQLPVHIHRSVDMFPEIFLYSPQEARGMFNAWETLILGTLLRVLQVEKQVDDFRYFYYSGYSADTNFIGDERGCVRTFFTEPSHFSWCVDEIVKRKQEVLKDPNQLKIYYGLLQILARDVFTADTVRLSGGQIVSLPSFQASVITKQLKEAEESANGNLPQRKPGDGNPSPEWDVLLSTAKTNAREVTVLRGGAPVSRFYMTSVEEFVHKRS